MTERESKQLTMTIRGKEADIAIAQGIKEAFVNGYKDERKFQELLTQIGSNTVDRLIHRLSRTEKINLYRDYRDLRKVAEEVMTTCYYEIYEDACSEEDAIFWINNKGKYHELVFESIYKIFYQYPKLQGYIEKGSNSLKDADKE